MSLFIFNAFEKFCLPVIEDVGYHTTRAAITETWYIPVGVAMMVLF